MLTRYFARPGGGILIALLTLFCFFCFSLNAILCRSALAACGMDPLRFVAVRCFSGAAMLFAIWAFARPGGAVGLWRELMAQSSWPCAIFLFCYMLCFACGYVAMPSATGTLIQNSAIQVSMIGWGVYCGLRPGRRQLAGLALAFAGLALLLAPGLSSPPFINALLIALAGLSWGAYTMAGRAVADPGLATAGNFLRASLPAAGVLLLSLMNEAGSRTGLEERALLYAIASGAGTSALGYTVWYVVQPRLSVMGSSASQLAVPPITAVLGLVLLGEAISPRLVVCGLMILAGIWLALRTAGRPVGA
ncbi:MULTISPECIES: DMT family transporter [unclassified Desulfovibrio]|uniref:DMT family transporter n=1 Tax=unclassified Desulfovibrio TaxID=2593640 RepID=UPI0013E9B354|nr:MULTISPECIES: DMT family transporter [unclassified Desulfovibrio]